MEDISWMSVLKDHPVIAAFRDLRQIDLSRLSPKIQVLFLLGGTIFDLQPVVDRCQQAGKQVFVDIDLLKGIAGDDWGVRYLAGTVRIQGLITTKPRLIKAARQEGLVAVQRIFVLDSESLTGALKVTKHTRPHAIEILPGVIWPKIASLFLSQINCPVIAGGFIRTMSEVETVLEAGALAVSSTSREIIFK